jgi:hypothetical protein
MPEQDFIDAGFDANYFTNLKHIVHDEEEHVILLTAAIEAAGAKPVAACEYHFPMTDVKSFLTLSSVLEGVGTSAYLGAAGLISSKANLGVAASILVTEALHTSLQRFSIGQVAAPNPYGTGLGVNAVFTLAAGFITSCPSTNSVLPVRAFPALTAAPGSTAAPGIASDFTVQGSVPEGIFVVFVSGLDTIAVPNPAVTGSTITAKIPESVQGQAYVFVTNAEPAGPISDSIVLYGPAIIEVKPPSPEFDLAVL